MVLIRNRRNPAASRPNPTAINVIKPNGSPSRTGGTKEGFEFNYKETMKYSAVNKFNSPSAEGPVFIGPSMVCNYIL